MHPSLKETIRRYAVMHDDSLKSDLQNAAPKDLAEQLLSLITMYVNDKNSSTLRELLVCTASGFQPIEEKLGYNGYRQKMDSAGTEYCEIKPVNVSIGGNRKLRGEGNFGDYTWKRFKKHKKENPVMLVAGFIEGRLVYVFQFPFANIADKLKEQLQKRLPDGDAPNNYVRSAEFSFSHYANKAGLQTRLFVGEKELKKMSGDITKNLYNHLAKFAQ